MFETRKQQINAESCKRFFRLMMEGKVISTQPVGTLYRTKTGAPVIKCSRKGEAEGSIWACTLAGDLVKYDTTDLKVYPQTDFAPSVVEKLQSMIKHGDEVPVQWNRPVAPEKSDGAKADYYDLPAGAETLQDLLSYRNMNHAMGEIFCATYRYGRASHSDQLRDAKKIKFYIEAEIKRLEKLNG